MRFAEFTVGQVLETRARPIGESEILEFARKYDAQWFHVDPQRAATGRWSGLIASGWHTCAVAMELAVEAYLGDSESFGSPGIDELRWLAPVRPGDLLTLKIEVLAARVSESGGTGSLRWRWTLLNQAASPVLDLLATSLFDLRDGPR